MPDNTIENFADLVAEVDTLRTDTEASLTQVNTSLNSIEFISVSGTVAINTAYIDIPVVNAKTTDIIIATRKSSSLHTDISSGVGTVTCTTNGTVRINLTATAGATTLLPFDLVLFHTV